MKKRIIGILLILILMGAFIANHFITYARISIPPLYVNLTATNANGVGYGIGNPDNSGKYIWNIVTYKYDSESTKYSVSDEKRNLYCVNADYGYTWFDEEKEDEILEYELYYDIQNIKDKELLAQLNNTMINTLLDPEGNQYRQLLWLFDNYYISNQTDINNYLAKAGILSYEYEDTTYYYKKVGNQNVDYPIGDPLTEDDIIAIQKMAIWYFTNNDNYNYTGNSNWLNILQSDGTYTALKNISESRNAMAMDLYQYLIDGAQSGASQYTSANNYKLDSAPISLNTKGLKQVDTDDKYMVDMTRSDENYLIGPIVIEQNNDLDYDLEIVVKDENGEILTKDTEYKYIYIDSEGNKIEKKETELVGLTEGIYVCVPRIRVENVSISIKISYISTSKKLWLSGTEEDETINLNAEQPLVEIKQDPQDIVVELVSKPEEFDLALRKYITSLRDKSGNEKEISNKRELDNIELETLLNGTTATYNHRKDPVIVEELDEVTYTIRIYNEGNKAGYASKIIDQLPNGLISSTSNASIVVSKGADGKERNQYKLQYDTVNNKIILTLVKWHEELQQNNLNEEGYIKEIQPYTIANGLDYETIEIKCTVAKEPDTTEQIVLTNVAWIAEAYEYDEKQGIYVITDNDRDSSTQSIPNVDQNNMGNYRGSSTDIDLSENKYFPGKEDDDDFEKLVIMPVPKKFDLALFKYIAAISKNQTIEDGEYITNTGNVDGIYLRAPVVTGIDSTTGKITYKQDDKAALTVESGDYVLYTIRVYNEGEIDGYASKIKDTLPVGLEFVIENEEYNGIWELEKITDSEGRQVITTTWFAKDQGAELYAKEGSTNYQANLLKALNKDGDITSENPDYIDAQVLCRVVEDATSKRVLVNYAQISDDSDADGNDIEDIDSTPDEWIDNDEHVDDDQDIERIQLQYFDLSLRKFITSVDGIKNNTREPKVYVSELVEGTSTTAEYQHSKEPLPVQVGNTIVYTIRVYNEGSIDGYANEVKDYLPTYLKYVENSELNEKYRWELSEDGRIATTQYLSDKEIKAFNGTDLDYEDIQIECIVSEDAPSNESQTNIAEISEYKYNGNIVKKDVDSTADNIVSAGYLPSDEELPAYKDEELSKKYVPGNQDDDDFEKIYVIEFDLALRKFVSKVIIIEDGKEKITETGYNGYEDPEPVVKVELHKKKLNSVIVKFAYGITITNEGDIPGYATEITDYIPEGLKFEDADNSNWIDEGNNVISTKQLENTLLQPGESATVEVILTWINDKNNMALKINTAEISEDKNEYNIPDKDSTPDNKIEGEDDIDIAKVILNVSTGSAKTYFILTLGILGVVLIGIVLIKKFVI